MEFDILLLRPTHVVWPEQAFKKHRELHTGTWIGGTEFLLHCDAEYAPKDSEFLMNRCRFQGPEFDAFLLTSNVSALLGPAP